MSGALPSGIVLDASKGTIAGIPRTAGNFLFSIAATDGEGRVATVSAVLTVAQRLAIKTLRLKVAERGRAYSTTLAAFGGVKPVRWKVVSGRLPLGIRLSNRLGTLAGTPRQAGVFRLTVKATDALGATTQMKLVLSVESQS
jgi:hypothetical protein